MNNQIVLDIKQIKPEALNIFYGHILRQCIMAKEDKNIMQEYKQYKEKNHLKISG